jgi:hypothetical protein
MPAMRFIERVKTCAWSKPRSAANWLIGDGFASEASFFALDSIVCGKRMHRRAKRLAKQNLATRRAEFENARAISDCEARLWMDGLDADERRAGTVEGHASVDAHDVARGLASNWCRPYRVP